MTSFEQKENITGKDPYTITAELAVLVRDLQDLLEKYGPLRYTGDFDSRISKTLADADLILRSSTSKDSPVP